MSRAHNTTSPEAAIRHHLQQRVPRFPKQELCRFVEQLIARKDVFLGLLNNNPAPLYVLEPDVLSKRFAQFRAAFQHQLPDVGFYYAVKSNNHPAVAQTLVREGAGLDVSSGVELAMALQTGASEIVFSGPGKTESELQLAVEHAQRVVLLMDSFGELARLKRITAGQEKIIRVGVRLTIDPKGLWRKFGIPAGRLGDFIKEVQEAPQLDIQGLQFHTSWNLSPTVQVECIRHLGTLLREFPKSQLDLIRFIDIGGGFWPSQGEWLQPAGTQAGRLKSQLGLDPENVLVHYRQKAASIEIFAQNIGLAVREHLHSVIPCRICVEPGRWLCNDAMHLLLSVVDCKDDDLVITDAGTNSVGWERFESDYFPVINLTRPALTEKPCDVHGSLCTPHDIWGYSYWGEDIREGDILLIPTQGAYTYSLRQNFIKPLPAVVTV